MTNPYQHMDFPPHPGPGDVRIEHADGGMTMILPGLAPSDLVNRLQKRGMVMLILGATALLALVIPWIRAQLNPQGVIVLITLGGLLLTVGALQWLGGRSLINAGVIIDIVGPPESPSRVLMITETEMLDKRNHRFISDEISHIDVGSADLGYLGTPLPKLQIHSRSGMVHRLFAGRSKDELQWIASVLRQALDLQQQPATGKHTA